MAIHFRFLLGFALFFSGFFFLVVFLFSFDTLVGASGTGDTWWYVGMGAIVLGVLLMLWGTRADRRVPTRADGPRGPLCPGCGESNPAWARFCNGCGRPLRSVEGAEPSPEPSRGEGPAPD
jgi:hypothetical protein